MWFNFSSSFFLIRYQSFKSYECNVKRHIRLFSIFLMTDDDAASLGFCLLLFFCSKSLTRQEIWKNSQWFLSSASGADGWKLSKSRFLSGSAGLGEFLIYFKCSTFSPAAEDENNQKLTHQINHNWFSYDFWLFILIIYLEKLCRSFAATSRQLFTVWLIAVELDTVMVECGVGWAWREH